MKKIFFIFISVIMFCAVDVVYASTAQEIQLLFPDEPQHPYVCVSKNDLENNVIADKIKKTPGDYWYRRVKTAADSAINQSVIQSIENDRYEALDTIRKEKDRIEVLGMMYLISGDDAYLNRGVKEVEALISLGLPFSDHYLYIGELAYTYALAYDWFYDGLTDSQKDKIASAIQTQCLDIAGGYIIDGTGFAALNTNINTVCTGGITTAAMAAYEKFPERASQIIEGAVRNTPRTIEAWKPDGVYAEGSMYWDYGTSYLAFMMSTMDNLFGDDFGLSQIDGFSEIGSFPRFINGNSGLDFNFGDSIETPCGGAQIYWFAKKNNHPEDILPRWNRRFSGKVYDLIWYDEKQKNDGLTKTATDELKNGKVNIAVFRSEDENGIYAAIKGGYNQTPHTDLDIGNFVLDAMGERWASDLGVEPYLDDYFIMSEANSPRWTYYAKRAEAHNVPIINPSYTADQNVKANCAISEFASDGSSGYALIDMTQAYPDARSVRRGMAVTDDKSRVIIRDEIRLKKSGTIYWMFHTEANAVIADGGRTVYLNMNNKTMKMTLLTGNGVFVTAEEKPLKTSPVSSVNLDRSNYTKIYIKMDKVLNTDIAVLFTPLNFGYNEKIITSPANIQLSEWSKIYGAGKEIINSEGIKNRQTDVSAKLSKLNFKNTDCGIENVACYEDKTRLNVTVVKENDDSITIDFNRELSDGKRYTIDFNSKCFSFSTAPITWTDDFEKDKGPTGIVAYTNWSGFIVNTFSRETANFTVVSGDAEKYGIDDTVIYMAGAQTDIKMVYHRENTIKACTTGYIKSNAGPECKISFYGAEQITDYNDLSQWSLITDTTKEVSSYTVGNGYNIVTYTAKLQSPVNYIMIVMEHNGISSTDKVYLPQLKDVILSSE